MKILYLLRHAHAEPQPTAFADHDRPLVERGWEEAKALATYFSTQNITVDFVMCSSALRAQETLEPLRSVVGTQDIEISESFYNIPEDDILKHLQKLPSPVGSVLYIGHNPGIAFAILRFSKSFPAFLNEGVSPATLVGLHFPIKEWVDLEWGRGEITDVFQPALASAEAPAPEKS